MTSSASGTAPASNPSQDLKNLPEFLGHPAPLFMLFFAEMWERFSYYGMRALLVFYMIKGFLGFHDNKAYTVYGAYTALVYMTPFIGGVVADRILGARKSVIMGGLLMAAGHLVMTIEDKTAFFLALALLIVGNGFFKPNISNILGQMYKDGSTKRDGGFTIFYMGVNMGAAMSPLVCGYVGETYGWHYGFGLATIGMLAGLAIFAAPTKFSQIMILFGSLGTATSLFFLWDSPYQAGANIFVALALLTAAVVAFFALRHSGLPRHAGAPNDPNIGKEKGFLFLSKQNSIYLAVAVAIPLLALFVGGSDAAEFIRATLGDTGLSKTFAYVVENSAGWVLMALGGFSIAYIGFSVLKSEKFVRERMLVVFILAFFMMCFWAFFEQAGSSINNFTDRNVDRVHEDHLITESDIGKTLELPVSQEMLGYTTTLGILGFPSEKPIPMTLNLVAELQSETKFIRWPVSSDDVGMKVILDDQEVTLTSQHVGQTLNIKLTDELAGHTLGPDRTLTNKVLHAMKTRTATLAWKVEASHVGMGVGNKEIPASIFQAVNPICILIFGLVLTAIWSFLGARGLEPSTPVKFSLALLQLGLGFGAYWLGAQYADARGMVAIPWLVLGYLLQTTGELCMQPIGLSMVTKLSPKILVSTVTGAWYMATAFSQYLAGMIAKLTGVEHGEGSSIGIPVPKETLHLYTDVFGKIALSAFVCALICFVLAPKLTQWMHNDKPQTET